MRTRQQLSELNSVTRGTQCDPCASSGGDDACAKESPQSASIEASSRRGGQGSRSCAPCAASKRLHPGFFPALHVCAACRSSATQPDASCLPCAPPARSPPWPCRSQCTIWQVPLRHEIQQGRSGTSGKDLTARRQTAKRVWQSAHSTAPCARPSASCCRAGWSAGGWRSSLRRRA